MRRTRVLRSKAMAGLICAMISVGMLNTALAEPDVVLDFAFVKLGQTRSQIIKALGPPNFESTSRTLGVVHRRSFWFAESKRFVISFIGNRAWRMKSCDVGLPDC